MKSSQPAITRGLDRLDALCRGRRQPVKGLDRLSGDWRAIKRAPIALDRLPPPARLHPSDQGPRQGRAPLRLLHPLKISTGPGPTCSALLLPVARSCRVSFLLGHSWGRPAAPFSVNVRSDPQRGGDHKVAPLWAVQADLKSIPSEQPKRLTRPPDRLLLQSDRRKSRMACWSVTGNLRKFCITAFASDGGYAGDAVDVEVAELAGEKCCWIACRRSLVRPS